MNYDMFLEALVRLACKGKQIFNSFAQNIGNSGLEINQSTVNQQKDNIDNDKNDDDDNKSNANVSMVAEGEKNPDNKELEGKGEKYIKLVDDYGNIEACTAKTVECLILYLALPEDKHGMDERFRQILEEGYKPDLKQKKILGQKLN